MTEKKDTSATLGHVIDWPARMHDPGGDAIGRFVAYWSSMRRNGDVPMRSDIDPRGIEDLLPNAFIVEKIAPGLARLRIAGTHLSDLMGMDVRGMPLSALIVPPSRDSLSRALVNVFDRPALARIGLAAPGGFGRPALTGTLVLLPLRSDLGDISRALGCLVSRGVTGRAPRRFSLSTSEITPVTLSARASGAPAFAEPAAPFKFDSGTRGHLRLVKND